jgi:polyhydroxyalkanoate synthesis regulator phasin
MTQAADTDIKELKDLMTGIREEMRVGFAKMEGKIDNVETKLEGKFDTVNARLTNLETNTKNIMDLAEKLGELKNWKQMGKAILQFRSIQG